MTQEIRFNSFGMPYIVEFANVSFVREHRKVDPSHESPYPRVPSPAPSLSELALSQSSSFPSPSSSTSSFCHIPSSSSSLPTKRRNIGQSLRAGSSSRLFSFPSVSSLFRRKPSPSPADSHPQCNSPLPPESIHASSNVLPTWCAIPPFTAPTPTRAHGADSHAEGLFIQFSSPATRAGVTRKERLAHLQRAIRHAVLDAGMDSPSNRANRDHHQATGHGSPSPRSGGQIPETLYCGTYGQMMAAMENAGLYAAPCLDTGFPGGTQIGALFVARHAGTDGIQLRKLTLWG